MIACSLEALKVGWTWQKNALNVTEKGTITSVADYKTLSESILFLTFAIIIYLRFKIYISFFCAFLVLFLL